MNNEQERINAGRAWRRWGPYLSERAWGTVREDYSANSDAWRYFPHDHARSRTYRWNEDGLAGICDDQQFLCFAIALWNEQDSILKERLFGLAGPEGNHGEDVKEAYFYLDNTPSHSWMQMLYKYPQTAFPYEQLVAETSRRNRNDPEYELVDTGIFHDQRYFDIFVEYAKAAPKDLLIQIRVINRGPEAAPIHLLPTLWFRNTWNWGYDHEQYQSKRPIIQRQNRATILATHSELGNYYLAAAPNLAIPALLFTENESNNQRLFGSQNRAAYLKDAFHHTVIQHDRSAVNPAEVGTKAAFHYQKLLAPGEEWLIQLRLTAEGQLSEPFADFQTIIAERQAEANTFYKDLQPNSLNDDERLIQRQAFAGMLWSKQFYYYDVAEWLAGDPGQPAPPAERRNGRNHDWPYLNCADIISMPDTWEYPWFAAWDLAFHCIPLALLDPTFAKEQLLLLGREWYQHPNGQIPAYEWEFSDVNPPVLAWAAWRVYKIDQKQQQHGDYAFLERMFHKLLLNFTWWVNRKDAEGNNIFQGGFLGLDNIGIFDRSSALPTGGHIEQSDGTAWMGMFCLNMLTISLELACTNQSYEDIASKFFEHFLYIAEALNNLGGQGISLWDHEDEFFYDVLHTPEGQNIPLKIRSIVGLIPLFAVTTIEPELLRKLPAFRSRLEWFLAHRPNLASLISRWHTPGVGERRLLALCRGHRMKRLLRRMLDPAEFLSDYGVRALSRYHKEHPYRFQIGNEQWEVSYQPGESNSWLFGGNSNWRGPIWFPINYLLIEALQQYHHYYGDDFKVECPTGSGIFLTLHAIADQLSQQLISIFRRDSSGKRAVFGEQNLFQSDPAWRDYLLFYEYFHGDHGYGLGASHQTGWTGLVAKLIQQQGEHP